MPASPTVLRLLSFLAACGLVFGAPAEAQTELLAGHAEAHTVRIAGPSEIRPAGTARAHVGDGEAAAGATSSLDRVARLLSPGAAPVILGLGDSYAVPAVHRVLYQMMRRYDGAPLRGLVVSKTIQNPTLNAGGFASLASATGAESRVVTPEADAYRVLEGVAADERQGLPVHQLQQIRFTPDHLAGPSGLLFDYRYFVAPLADATAGALVTAEEAAARQPITARVLAYAPHTPDALHADPILLHDRLLAETSREASFIPVELAPSPGSFYAWPDVELDNPGGLAGADPFYAVRALAGRTAEGTPVGGGRYLHLAGCLLHRPDRTQGPVWAWLADESWSYTGHGVDADPTENAPKQFATADATSYLSAIRLDDDQPLLVLLHLNNEFAPGATPAAQSAFFQARLEGIRGRWLAAAEAAGYGEVTFLLVQGFAQGILPAFADNAALATALRAVADEHDDTAALSLWELTGGIVLDGRPEAAEFLLRVGRPDLAGAPLNGDLLDDPYAVHPIDADAAEFLADLLLAEIPIIAVSTEPDASPGLPALSPPRPNPSSGTVRLAFVLAGGGRARLTLSDALGREVAVLTDAELAAGRHEIDLDGRRLAAGTYVVRLSADGRVFTQRLTVTR